MPLALISDRVGIILMTVIFNILIIFSVILRLRARSLTKASLKTDDWLAVLALLLTISLNAVFLAGTVEGAITGHSVVVDDLPVTNDLEILMQKYKYAYQVLEKPVFGVIKLSILFLWKRLFGTSRPFTILCYVMMGIVVGWMVAFFFETIFQCGTNWSLNWSPIFVFLTQCTASLDVLTAFGVTDVVTDLIIIAMPIPVIWSLQMQKRKKAAITAIFTLGFFTIIAGVLRLFYYLATSYNKKENPDFIADATLTLVWSTIEVNVALMVCCLPVLSPILVKFRDRVTSRSHRSGITKYIDITHERLSGKGGYQLNSMSRGKNGGADGTMSSISQQELWHDGHGTVTSAGFSGATEPANHKSGILARTEISTTVEDSVPHAV